MPLATFVSLIPPRGFAAPTGDAKKGFALIKTSGRSMIEMLGVLAIIGVLSAGGIMGYTTAMENYNVNKFITITKQAVAGASSVFTKAHGRGGAYGNDTRFFRIEELYRLGIIPKELYDNKITYDRTKSPFGGRWYINGAEGLSFCAGLTLANGTVTPDFKNYSYLHSQVDNLPKSTCVKIATHDWRGMGALYTYFILNGKWYESTTVAEAEAACNLDKNEIGISIGIIGQHS